jgi:butyrate kinase
MSEKSPLILAINLGSASTKMGLYRGKKEVALKTHVHSTDEFSALLDIKDQLPYRREAIQRFLEEHKVQIDDLSAIVSRGGEMRPLPGGAYRVNQEMIDDLLNCRYGEHPTNLGAVLAQELLTSSGETIALVIDPPTSDEFSPLARLSGLKEMPRRSCLHVLNQRSVGKRLAKDLGRNYADLKLIGVHLGGGISVTAHENGRLIDANNGLDGDGPYSPQRAGTLPADALVELCFSGKYTQKEVYSFLTTKGGLMSHLGTQDAEEVEKRIEEGDAKARLIYEGMAYQIAKEIGSMATVFKGQVDGIFFTGGLAHSQILIDWVKERVTFLAPIYIYPGEAELNALVEGTLEVLEEKQILKEYAAVEQTHQS